jgi:DNA-binding NarL/FixJ family response regulator
VNAPTVQQSSGRILIVDDHPLFRDGLRQLIDREAGLSVCGEATGAEDAIRLAADTKPDLVIVDILLGNENGIDLIRSLKANDSELPVLVVSMHEESLYAERALRAGAMGYVMKDEPPKTYKLAIRSVLAGEMYLSPRMATSLVAKLMHGTKEEEQTSVGLLSDRELEVFRRLGQGKGTRQIAEELGLTVRTIGSFRARIKEKLQIKNSAELILQAIRWVHEKPQKIS